MRIVIDMQGAQSDSRFRGIGRFTKSLTQAMVRRANQHEIILVLNAQMPESIPSIFRDFEDLLPPGHIRIFDVPATTQEGGWENEVSEVLRESFLASLKPDVVLLTSVIEGFMGMAVTSIGRFSPELKTAAILYDLIPLLHPDDYLYTTEIRNYYQWKIEWLKRSDVLLGISDSSCGEGISHLGKREDQVVNISGAIGSEFQQPKVDESILALLLKNLEINRNFVLYAPGGFDPRKNFERLIAAYSAMSGALRARHQLVIVSKLQPEHRQQLVQLSDKYGLAPDELVLPGYVEDADLIALYAAATLFVFPSLHEGFGLPVLEAMACGAPTIGSNCTSVPEVIGWNEALFDPYSVDAIRAKMAQALEDGAFRDQLKAHSALQSKKFSWDTCADRALVALETLHAAPIPDRVRFNEARGHQHLIQTIANIQRPEYLNPIALQNAAQCLVFNQGNNGGQRQLLLDVSELAKGDARSGIQRVVRSILWELLDSSPTGFDVRPIRFDGVRYWYANQLAASLHKSCRPVEDTIADFFQGDIYLCLDLLMHLRSSFFEAHQALAARGVSMNYLIYDLLPLQRPDWWSPVIQPQFLSWISELSKVAERMVCISATVANELIAWHVQHPPERVAKGPKTLSFHLGADVNNSSPSMGLPENAQQVLHQMAQDTSFLMVSTIEPRKGHAQALAAFDLLWSQGKRANLVIVGKRGWQVEALVEQLQNHPQNGLQLHWLEGVSDEFLERVYAASDCLLAPTLGEGFGLPLIEAAQHQLPILARDLPVLKEVAGEHAYYFSGLEPEDLASAIEAWLHLMTQDQHPKVIGLPWLTWKQSTQQLLTALDITPPSSLPSLT